MVKINCTRCNLQNLTEVKEILQLRWQEENKGKFGPLPKDQRVPAAEDIKEAKELNIPFFPLPFSSIFTKKVNMKQLLSGKRNNISA